MAKAHVYLLPGANVESSDTFASWLDTTNQLVYDMGTVVLTTTSSSQPNTAVGGYTVGNAHVQGIFSANTLVATNGLRGGLTSSSGNLFIVSNTVFSQSNLIEVSSNTNNFNISANNTLFSGNVAITSSKTFSISAANTQFVSGPVYLKSNTEFSGVRADIATQFLGISANTSLTASKLYADVDNISLGTNSTDMLVVNASADFNSSVNIDGIFTSTANATFGGSLFTISSNNVVIGNSIVDRLVVNSYLDSNLIPSSTIVDLGSDLRPYGNIHTTYVWADSNIESLGKVVLKGSTTKTIETVGSNGSYQNLNLTFSNNTVSNTSIVANTSGLFGGYSQLYSLGSSSVNWKELYVKNSFVTGNEVVSGNVAIGQNLSVANSVSITGNLSVNGQITVTNSNVSLSISTSDINDLTVYDQLTLDTATIGSSLIPTTNTIHDIGTNALRWGSAYTKDIYASNSMVADHLSSNTASLKSITIGDGSKDSIQIASSTFGSSSRKITIKTPDTAIANNYTVTLAVGNTVLQTGTMAVVGTSLSQFANTTSAQLAAIMSDETGSGSLVFSTGPSIISAELIGAKISSNGASFAGATSGVTTLKASAIAANTSIILPAANGTIALTSDIKDATISIVAGDGMTGGGTFTSNQFANSSITITNNDRGSAQNIFKNIKIGTTTLTAADNNDRIALSAGGGISIDVSEIGTKNIITFTSTETDTLSSVTSRGANTNTAIVFANTTDSTATNIGAITVAGGVGVSKGLQIGGQARFYSNAQIDATLTAANLIVSGNLIVNGTTTTINTTDLAVTDRNIVIGDVATPTNTTANGGGITLRGTTDKTITWESTGSNWASSENFNLITGKAYKINNSTVLSATTLGSTVTTSSLTSVGTISSGIWNATVIAVNKGGTGQTTYTNGELLIGNSAGNTLTKATLDAGDNISITNGPGSIAISAANTNLGTNYTTSKVTITSSTGNGIDLIAANSTSAGVLTSIAQTIAGNKTFNGYITVESALPKIQFNDINDSSIYSITTASSEFRINNGLNVPLVKISDAGMNVLPDITTNGDVLIYSDERLKTNIHTIDNALKKVNNMRGVYFDKDGRSRVGVIAQEIEKVLPEVVNDGEYKSVAYGNIVAVLIEAIKELKHEIDTIKSCK